MYCPKCGHQAVSNNVRYCPGCGFRLHGVAELIANDGLSAADEEKTLKPRRSLVKRGAVLGATLMLIASLMAMELRPSGAGFLFSWVALMTIIGVSGYLKRLITNISNIFSEEEPSPSKKSAYHRGSALPAAQSAPVADSGQQLVDTTKMGHPSSITEQTTSRLNKV